jgi:hypothetical protein
MKNTVARELSRDPRHILVAAKVRQLRRVAVEFKFRSTYTTKMVLLRCIENISRGTGDFTFAPGPAALTRL